jgi:hypothetical protein
MIVSNLNYIGAYAVVYYEALSGISEMKITNKMESKQII